MAIIRTCFLTLLSGVLSLLRASRTSRRGVGSDADALWQAYITENSGSDPPRQSACTPRVHEATGAYRGAILLLHGFTACPQQFENLIPLLTASGYTVYTPILPGHGYEAGTKGGKIHDYTAKLPLNPEGYLPFVQQMHDLMMKVNGQKVIFGLSLGGTLAAHTARLGGFDRVFLAVPLIHMAGTMGTVVDIYDEKLRDLRILGAIGRAVGKKTVGWGEGCEKERSKGRAGICEFKVSNVVAVERLGDLHREEVEASGAEFKPGGLQMVFVQEDGAASPDAITDLAVSYGYDKSSKSICGMDPAIGHSFLSPYDNPDEDKYWLDEVTQMVADYLTDGVPLPQGPDGETLGDGWPRCNVQSAPSEAL